MLSFIRNQYFMNKINTLTVILFIHFPTPTSTTTNSLSNKTSESQSHNCYPQGLIANTYS